MDNGNAITRVYNGVEILQWPDGSMNATAMCKANGKEWSNYWQNQATQEFAETLARSLGIPRDLLIEKQLTGPNESRGTRVHKLLGYHLAQWCSPDFAVRVVQWIDELATKGRVELPNAPPSPALARIEEEIAGLKRLLLSPASPPARPIALVEPREFTLRCWPEVPDNTLKNVVRRMDASYRSKLGRPAPQESEDPSSRLMCEPEHLWTLTNAIAYYWRKEHPPEEPELAFDE